MKCHLPGAEGTEASAGGKVVPTSDSWARLLCKALALKPNSQRWTGFSSFPVLPKVRSTAGTEGPKAGSYGVGEAKSRVWEEKDFRLASKEFWQIIR